METGKWDNEQRPAWIPVSGTPWEALGLPHLMANLFKAMDHISIPFKGHFALSEHFFVGHILFHHEQ